MSNSFASPWTVTLQAPLSMSFPRQEYWSGLPFPSLGDLPDPGIKPRSPALQADSLPTELQGKPLLCHMYFKYIFSLNIYVLTLLMKVQFLRQEDPLEKEMATHSSSLTWRIPWTEEPGRGPRGRKESDMTERLHFLFFQILFQVSLTKEINCSGYKMRPIFSVPL